MTSHHPRTLYPMLTFIAFALLVSLASSDVCYFGATPTGTIFRCYSLHGDHLVNATNAQPSSIQRWTDLQISADYSRICYASLHFENASDMSANNVYASCVAFDSARSHVSHIGLSGWFYMPAGLRLAISPAGDSFCVQLLDYSDEAPHYPYPRVACMNLTLDAPNGGTFLPYPKSYMTSFEFDDDYDFAIVGSDVGMYFVSTFRTAPLYVEVDVVAHRGVFWESLYGDSLFAQHTVQIRANARNNTHYAVLVASPAYAYVYDSVVNPMPRVSRILDESYDGDVFTFDMAYSPLGDILCVRITLRSQWCPHEK